MLPSPPKKKKKTKTKYQIEFAHFDLIADGFFEMERIRKPLELVQYRIKEIKRAISIISDHFTNYFRDTLNARELPNLPRIVTKVLMELAEIEHITQKYRDFIETMTRLHIVTITLGSYGFVIAPKHEQNVLYNFIRTLKIRHASTIKGQGKGKEKVPEEEEEEEEEEVNLIIPYEGPLDPHEIEPSYIEIMRVIRNTHFDRIGGIFDRVYFLLDLATYRHKRYQPDQVRKRKRIMLQREDALYDYAAKVWDYMTVRRSELDKQRMRAFHQYYSAQFLRLDDSAERLTFVANLNASNLTGLTPPGYYTWFVSHADSVGTFAAVKRLWIRNNILLSSPQMLMLMQHELLHMYTSNELHPILQHPTATLTGKVKYTTETYVTNASPILMIRIRSDFDNFGLGAPVKLLVAGRKIIGGGRIQRWRLDQNDLINELFNLRLGVSQNQIGVPALAITFVVAAGGKRIGFLPKQPINLNYTPFLNIAWITNHELRIRQWKAWSEADPDHEARLKEAKRQRGL